MKLSKRSLLVAALSLSVAGIAGAEGMRSEKQMPMHMEQMSDMPMSKEANSEKSGEVHKATGTVKKVNKEKGKVTLSHGPVKSLNWSAMTMAFQVSDPDLFEKLTTGSTVEFEFIKKGKNYVVVSAK